MSKILNKILLITSFIIFTYCNTFDNEGKYKFESNNSGNGNNLSKNLIPKKSKMKAFKLAKFFKSKNAKLNRSANKIVSFQKYKDKLEEIGKSSSSNNKIINIRNIIKEFSSDFSIFDKEKIELYKISNNIILEFAENEFKKIYNEFNTQRTKRDEKKLNKILKDIKEITTNIKSSSLINLNIATINISLVEKITKFQELKKEIDNQISYLKRVEEDKEKQSGLNEQSKFISKIKITISNLNDLTKLFDNISLQNIKESYIPKIKEIANLNQNDIQKYNAKPKINDFNSLLIKSLNQIIENFEKKLKALKDLENEIITKFAEPEKQTIEELNKRYNDTYTRYKINSDKEFKKYITTINSLKALIKESDKPKINLIEKEKEINDSKTKINDTFKKILEHIKIRTEKIKNQKTKLDDYKNQINDAYNEVLIVDEPKNSLEKFEKLRKDYDSLYQQIKSEIKESEDTKEKNKIMRSTLNDNIEEAKIFLKIKIISKDIDIIKNIKGKKRNELLKHLYDLKGIKRALNNNLSIKNIKSGYGKRKLQIKKNEVEILDVNMKNILFVTLQKEKEKKISLHSFSAYIKNQNEKLNKNIKKRFISKKARTKYVNGRLDNINNKLDTTEYNELYKLKIELESIEEIISKNKNKFFDYESLSDRIFLLKQTINIISDKSINYLLQDLITREGKKEVTVTDKTKILENRINKELKNTKDLYYKSSARIKILDSLKKKNPKQTLISQIESQIKEAEAFNQMKPLEAEFNILKQGKWPSNFTQTSFDDFKKGLNKINNLKSDIKSEFGKKILEQDFYKDIKQTKKQVNQFKYDFLESKIDKKKRKQIAKKFKYITGLIKSGNKVLASKSRIPFVKKDLNKDAKNYLNNIDITKIKHLYSVENSDFDELLTISKGVNQIILILHKIKDKNIEKTISNKIDDKINYLLIFNNKINKLISERLNTEKLIEEEESKSEIR